MTKHTDIPNDDEAAKKLIEEVKSKKAKTCPRCNQQSYIVSIFGSICSRCFYEPKEDVKWQK